MYQLYVFVLLLFIGVFLSSEGLIRLKKNFGAMIQIRQKYKKHIVELLIAQSLYILAIVLISSALFFGSLKNSVGTLK